MKRSLFICLILLNIGFSFGQSIVTSNRQWYNFINYYAFPGPVLGEEHLRFSADTVINSLTYKKVERSLDSDPLLWSSYGFIREDPNKKVFYKMYASESERLLYDLNAGVHDTILVYGLITSYENMNLDSMSFFVRNIDSTLVGQVYRKRINLALAVDTGSVFEQWVDSIGSLGGMLHNKYTLVGCDYYKLQCYFENGVLMYHDPGYPSCTYISGVSETAASALTVTIFPNPVSDVSTMIVKGIEDNTPVSVTLYNSYGKEVYRAACGNRLKLCKNSFTGGMYFYSISNAGKLIKSGKILIK